MDSDKEPVLGPDLLLALERGDGATLHEQLELRLREQVRSGKLPPGTKLPSSRALAAELGISRGVVLEAYAQLTAEGYLTATQGAATRVAATPSTERPPVPAGSLEPKFLHDFDPGLPDLAAFPREAWSRSLRAALREARFDELGRADPRGSAALRNELMSHLGRVRGAAPEPEHTLVTSGFAQGFSLVCRALADRGLERIALEEPGYAQHRLIAERTRLSPVPVRIDEHGIDVDQLGESGCEVVVLTPAHQFPTGVVLASERRAELLEWAEDEDALIIEDDYDSELRLDRVSVGALQGLSPERVCNVGSFSKRLVPGVRLGWILSPSWLTGALTYERALSEGGTPVLEQLALADFIARGELDRHMRRMRLRYRERRDALLAALASALPSSQVSGVAAGVFALVLLADDIDEERVLSAAAARGMGVEGLGTHRCSPGGPPGIVLGYGNVGAESVADLIGLLAEAVGEASMP